jgi:ankyrin repeat protein
VYVFFLFSLSSFVSLLGPKVPHLGLHSAAATGNIGLAKYALSHGQPINSVIDGVLPLHAACSGGNDMVVRLLIDNGADVNAPRYFFFLAPLIAPNPALISV